MPLAGLANLVAPSFFIVAVLMMLAWFIERHSDFYSGLVDREQAANRFHSIDGLRGFLAIFVLLHHSVVNYFFYSVGRWSTPPSRVATLLGQGGVAMFFMVTSLLFCHRALTLRGRVNLRRFFWSRIQRIVPMYMASALIVVLVACALTHFRLNVPLSQFAKDCSAWLLFTFPGTPAVNGYSDTPLINTVYWSLVYEWKFYLIFPILIFFASGFASFIAIGVCALLIHWYSSSNVEWYFIYGALTASVIYYFPSIKRIMAGSLGSVALVALLFVISRTAETAYDSHKAPLFFLAFLIIASGNTLFGLLTCRPARVLGAISYSAYLIHNIILYLVFRLVNHFVAIASLGLETYWCITAVIGVLTVICSAITYRHIEHRFMKFGIPRRMHCKDALLRRFGLR